MADTPVSDSYIFTVEEADAFFANRLGVSAWTGPNKAKALQMATAAIDALPLRGRKYMLDGSQDRQFPREYRGGYDMNMLTGDAEVPQAVKDACCLEALALLEAQGTSTRRTLQEQGVQSYQIPGIISETFAPGAATRNYGLQSPEAYRYLSKYIARSVPIV